MTDEQSIGGPVENTDRHLWPQVSDETTPGSIFVTRGDGIGINCSGHVFVKSLREWHRLAHAAEIAPTHEQLCVAIERAQEALTRVAAHDRATPGLSYDSEQLRADSAVSHAKLGLEDIARALHPQSVNNSK